MLTNKVPNNILTLKAIPTKSGNGFTAGKTYTFTHVRNGLYQTSNDHGHLRYESGFGKKSAHLWDGKNWLAMGSFEIIERIHVNP